MYLLTDECEFEYDMCTWVNDQKDTAGFDWQRGVSGSEKSGTGPQTDHTLGTPTGNRSSSNTMKNLYEVLR